jgi:hypothetical protein
MTLKAVSDDPTELCAMAGPAAFEYFMEQQRIAPNWKNELTLRSMDLCRSVENSVFTPWISPTPLLMIVALDDDLAWPDLALDAYEQPKSLRSSCCCPETISVHTRRNSR